jgi:hypothetical protein
LGFCFLEEHYIYFFFSDKHYIFCLGKTSTQLRRRHHHRQHKQRRTKPVGQVEAQEHRGRPHVHVSSRARKIWRSISSFLSLESLKSMWHILCQRSAQFAETQFAVLSCASSLSSSLVHISWQ